MKKIVFSAKLTNAALKEVKFNKAIGYQLHNCAGLINRSLSSCLYRYPKSINSTTFNSVSKTYRIDSFCELGQTMAQRSIT